jgi:hypothetical protein
MIMLMHFNIWSAWSRKNTLEFANVLVLLELIWSSSGFFGLLIGAIKNL